jgi:TolA-binding protein
MHWINCFCGFNPAVVEIFAAIAGASLTVAATAASGMTRRANDGRDAVIRLTVAVDNVASRLEVLHSDIKARDVEVFSRLRDLESAVARLEGSNINT